MHTYTHTHIHTGSGTTAAGYWGDYQCDLPYHTLENLMQHLQSISDEVHTRTHVHTTQLNYMYIVSRYARVC